jgi:hypothetical protein
VPERLRVDAVRGELIGADEALFVYFPAPDSSHVFVVDADTLRHFALPPSVELREAENSLVRALSSPPRHEADGSVSPADAQRWRRAARRLGTLVLPEEARAFVAEHRAVTVVGADLLSWFPFECLLLDDERTIGEAIAVSHLPSVPFGLALRRRDRLPVGDVAFRLIAAPEHSRSTRAAWPELESLPVDKRALLRVAARYAKAELFLGRDATRAALLAEPAATVVQLLCHGVYDASRLRPAGLLLAPDPAGAYDGPLWCEDAELQPTADLVVLAACGAGRGPQRRGDESVNHLGGAFLGAGARAVVQSHADLDYRATLRLSETLHARLATGGTSPAEALRAARAELRADPRFDHPYYHSLLQVLGLGHDPIF